jgi:hypothetical protein
MSSASGLPAGLEAGLLAALVGLCLGTAQAADGPSYADSVDRALTLVRSAPAGDTSAAAEAADVLQAGTGSTEPEILDDLRATPPRLDDARVRLTALERAVRSPAFTPEPRKADDAVRGILSRPRYAAIQGGPSLWERLQAAVVRLAVWALDHLGPRGGVPSWVRWIVPVVALTLLVLVAALVLRSVRGHGRKEARIAGQALASGEAAHDRFADADRLAAAGRFPDAVRSLAGGVAAALGDERDWEVSPLTVREIFGRSPDPVALGPLLAAFEAAVYGGRELDAETYARAERAAAPYRRPSREKAA